MLGPVPLLHKMLSSRSLGIAVCLLRLHVKRVHPDRTTGDRKTPPVPRGLRQASESSDAFLKLGVSFIPASERTARAVVGMSLLLECPPHVSLLPPGNALAGDPFPSQADEENQKAP